MTEWIRWDCPSCGRTNDIPAEVVDEAVTQVGKDALRFICVHPACGYTATRFEVTLHTAESRRDPWEGEEA